MDFIYQIIKKEEEMKIILEVFSINENKQKKYKKIKLNYEILCIKADFEKLQIKTKNIEVFNKKFKNKKGEEIIKLLIKNKELYLYIKSELKENKFEIFEADLPIEHSYLINNEIEISKNEKYMPFKYLSVDIETTGKSLDKQEIILISSYSPNEKGGNKVYVNFEKLIDKKIIERCKFKEFEIVKCNDEKDMLEKFKNDIIEFEPQIIMGWNVVDFDFKMIRDRMKIFEVEFKFSKYDKNECKLRIFNDFFRDSSMSCSGILILDIISIVKTNFIVFEDYKLDTVAYAVLNENKIKVSNDEATKNGMENKFEEIKRLFIENPKKLIEYNFKDSVLVSKIVEKLKLLELMSKRSILTNTPFSKVKSPIATLDIMYLTKLHKKGLIAPSNFNYSTSTPIEGAYVVEPKCGFYKNIFVFDFKSLYPSVIMTFNIDPFSYCETGEIAAPNGAKFDNKRGILPELILKLYKERDIAKKENDDIKSYALKTTMNSFYGAMASPKSRYYNKEIAGAITAFAREIIQKAKRYVEKLGYQVIYGDTDSIFVEIKNLEEKNLNEKKEIGRLLEEKINIFFKNWVKKEFSQENFLFIENEKCYSNFFIASKKRYVGFDQYSNKLGFVGMEAIRGDWSQVAKNFQIELVKMIFSNLDKKSIKEFILKYIDELNKGEFDKLLVYTKKITKPLEMYVKMTPPHVRAAREVENFNGRIVKYVQTIYGPKHISLINNKTNYDYKHYIEKQLKGVSDDLLESLGLDFDEIVQSKSQKSLSGFF